MQFKICPFPKIMLKKNIKIKNEYYYMSHAYNEAIKAWNSDEVPIGAIIRNNTQIIGKSFNLVEKKKV